MKRLKRINVKLTLVILLLLITVGYALLSTNVNINGTSKIVDAKWNIHFENIRVTNGSVSIGENDSAASINSENNTEVNYSITLTKPTDFYEFLVDVKNDGSIDGMIDSVSSKIKLNDNEYIEITDNNIPKYLKYSVSYSDNTLIKEKHELDAGNKETYKVRVEYNKDIEETDLPLTEQIIGLKLEVNYVQKDDSAVTVPKLETGRYISLTPTNTSYTVDKELTGYDTDQIINPSELKLWRIIKINNDGTIDAVSEYTSSNDIYFKGTQGFSNLVNGLNTIANSYNIEGYTNKVRNIGYDNQTLTLTNTSLYDGTSNNVPFDHTQTLSVSGNGKEYDNGYAGDTLYLKDYKLVKDTYGSTGVKSTRVNNKNQSSYWLTSRRYKYNSNNSFRFGAVIVNENGLLTDDAIFRTYDNEWQDSEAAYALRPIITLNNSIRIESGLGNIDTPYQLA